MNIYLSDLERHWFQESSQEVREVHQSKVSISGFAALHAHDIARSLLSRPTS